MLWFTGIILFFVSCVSGPEEITQSHGSVRQNLELPNYVRDIFGDDIKIDLNEIVISDPPPPTDKPVESLFAGKIPDHFEVGQNGAVNYSIPILLPYSGNNSQPNLALTYNSRGGDGSLGVGWSLSGLSVISRCPSTYLHDGVLREVTEESCARTL